MNTEGKFAPERKLRGLPIAVQIGICLLFLTIAMFVTSLIPSQVPPGG